MNQTGQRMQKRAQHKELACLRVSGRPLLTAVALGTTPLLWVACRTSPCLLHIFQDGHLVAVLHFRSEPTFLLLGDPVEERHEVATVGQGRGKTSNAASLLVITADGGIWLLDVPSCGLSSGKLNQDQQRKRNADSEPASGARAKSQEQSKLSSGSWQLFEDNDAYEIGSKPTPVGARMAKSEDTASVSLKWRNLKVSGSKNTLESTKATLVTDEALMAVVPTARVATFVRRNSVVVVSQTGPPTFLQANSKPLLGPQPERGCEQVCEPTCLLVGWNYGANCHKEDDARGNAFTEKLFTSICGDGGHGTTQYVLLQGDNQGRVYVHAVPNAGFCGITSKVLCDLQEPIVGLLPLPFAWRDEQVQGLAEIEGVLIVGRLGTVVALFAANQELSDSPFLPRNNTRRMRDIRLTATDVGFRDWKIKSPVTSVCMVGLNYVCYTAGSDVCCAEIFESVSVSCDPSQSSSTKLRYRPSHKTVSVADRVCVIAGNASARRPFIGRPLVALTTRGRLMSLELLDQPASNAVVDKKTSARPSTSWGMSQTRTRDKVKDLLQAVADIARQTDDVRNQCKAINVAIYELAASLHLAYVLSKEKVGWPLICPAWTPPYYDSDAARQPPPTPESKGICCMVRVYQPAVLEICPEHFLFSPALSSTASDDASPIPDPPPLTHVLVNLQNRSEYVLSPYWTLILKFEGVSPAFKPVAVYTSLVINSSQGLQNGASFSHDFKVKLPGSYLSPVVVTVLLCHVHDYHGLLVSSLHVKDYPSQDQWRGTDGTGCKVQNTALDSAAVLEGLKSKDAGIQENHTPGAVCFPIAQYRVDILSFLRAPPEGSSWCVTSAATSKENVRHSVGSREQNAEDDPLLFGRLSLDGFKQQVRADAEKLSDWKTFHLQDLLHQGAVSKTGDRICLVSPTNVIVTITIQRSDDGQKCQYLLFQTTSEALCCLVREALIFRLTLCEREDTVDESKADTENDRKRLKMRGGKLVAVVEEVTEHSEPDPNLASSGKLTNFVEVLSYHAEAVTAEWRRVFTSNTADSADTVAPLLAQTYEIVKDFVRAYRRHRNGPASSLY